MPITPKNKAAEIGTDVVTEDVGAGVPGLPTLDSRQLSPYVGDTGTGGRAGILPAPPAGAGHHRFANSDGTWHNVEQVDLWVRKGSPGTIAKGSPVYISGYNPGLGVFEVEEAKADAAATMPAIGLAAEPITNAALAMMIHNGMLENTKTDYPGWVASDDLYVSATAAGVLQNSRPTGGTSLIQKMGEVLRSHASQGVIQVYGAGRVNEAPNMPHGYTMLGDANGIPQPVVPVHKKHSFEWVGLAQTTSLTYVQVATTTTPALEAGMYRIEWYIEGNAVGDDPVYRIQQNNAINIILDIGPRESRNIVFASGWVEKPLVGAHTFDLDHLSGGGGIAGTTLFRLSVERVG